MRCLTLAEALRDEGAECYFICREHSGNLLDFIRDKNFQAFGLAPITDESYIHSPVSRGDGLRHSNWLGTTQLQDAEECENLLKVLRPHWLVVDHYALDIQWEKTLQGNFKELLVIDDLADRKHICSLLLDQNLGRTEQDYRGLVPHNCRILVGPKFALLRPEFSRLRSKSLVRRGSSTLQHLLITMGGMDQTNATCTVLQALKTCSLPDNCHISVVMGLKAPYLTLVKDIAATMPWPTSVLVNVVDMAERMASADLIIGAAGGTSWERSCLGVPTILLILAANQEPGAKALLHSGSVILIENVFDITIRLPPTIEALTHGGALMELSNKARHVCDGLGVERVLKNMSYNNG